MLDMMQKELIINRHFDRERCRHYLNDELTVLHCHHYASLYTQLAIDAKETELLTQVTEETFQPILKNYFQQNNVESIEERTDAACRYYSTIGLGKMDIRYIGSDSGEVILTRSHVDEGWIKKWKQYDAPVNYIGAGYIAAMFDAIMDEPKGTFAVKEIESIVMGSKISRFKVYRA